MNLKKLNEENMDKKTNLIKTPGKQDKTNTDLIMMIFFLFNKQNKRTGFLVADRWMIMITIAK